MEYDRFEVPITIYAELGVPRTIETVADAKAFLDECPRKLRGIGYAMAVDACRMTADRWANALTARAAFARFARHNGILSPSIYEVIAANTLGTHADRSIS